MAPRIHAPELTPNRGWLNTPHPLDLAALRGRVVVLDFWTSCCVNCQHVLPVLAALEARRAGQPLVVIGVHSAKFTSEEDPRHVADAVALHGITHPVVVDAEMAIWQQYAVRSWPTLVILRPDGTVAAMAPGEPDLDELDAYLQTVFDAARADGTLQETALPAGEDAGAAPMPRRPGVLRYPTRLAVAPDGRFAVSDAGHHRILLFSPEGACLAAFGDGRPGLVDGAAPRFRRPNGLDFEGDDVLWVADTENHALRRIDLVAGTVETVAGTGQLGVDYLRGSTPAREAALRSPWDLVAIQGDLVVAMAGTHQLHLYDAADGTIGPLAGTGREALTDGTVAEAAFAQPSGLALAFPLLFVADAETSAIRLVHLAQHTVQTLVGHGLFDFGFVDGRRAEARLQHPLGVALSPDGVVVADTYNSAIRAITPTGAVSTLHRGDLRAPEGIRHHRGTWLVADTGNHRIVRLAAGGAWLGEVTLTGVPTPDLVELPVIGVGCPEWGCGVPTVSPAGSPGG